MAAGGRGKACKHGRPVMGKHLYEGGLMSAETSGETALPSFVEECSEFVVRGIGRRSRVCVICMVRRRTARGIAKKRTSSLRKCIRPTVGDNSPALMMIRRMPVLHKASVMTNHTLRFSGTPFGLLSRLSCSSADLDRDLPDSRSSRGGGKVESVVGLSKRCVFSTAKLIPLPPGAGADIHCRPPFVCFRPIMLLQAADHLIKAMLRQ